MRLRVGISYEDELTENEERPATAAERSSMGKSWCLKKEAARPEPKPLGPATELRGRGFAATIAA
jgi:hypothetical protein